MNSGRILTNYFITTNSIITNVLMLLENVTDAASTAGNQLSGNENLETHIDL